MLQEDENSEELVFNGNFQTYHLETAVKAVSSLSLIKRLNRLKRKRARHTSTSSVSSSQSKKRKGNLERFNDVGI